MNVDGSFVMSVVLNHNTRRHNSQDFHLHRKRCGSPGRNLSSRTNAMAVPDGTSQAGRMLWQSLTEPLKQNERYGSH